MESLNFQHLLKENFSENKTGETGIEKIHWVSYFWFILLYVEWEDFDFTIIFQVVLKSKRPNNEVSREKYFTWF